MCKAGTHLDILPFQGLGARVVQRAIVEEMSEEQMRRNSDVMGICRASLFRLQQGREKGMMPSQTRLDGSVSLQESAASADRILGNLQAGNDISLKWKNPPWPSKY